MEETGTKFTDCLDPKGGYENLDGYVRVVNTLDEHQNLIMRHRLYWRRSTGESIPDGYEINHLCKNRRCCNPDHLELIERSAHKTLTNLERYAHVVALGKTLIEEGWPVKAIAWFTDRTVNSVNRWKRDLNENGSH